MQEQNAHLSPTYTGLIRWSAITLHATFTIAIMAQHSQFSYVTNEVQWKFTA